MDNNQMKNMVVLKNLPSNIVEEAIIVLKPNKKVKKIEYIKNKDKNNKQVKQENRYIIREAEMVISNYLKEMEEKKKPKNYGLEKKYNRLKYINFTLALIALVEFIIL